MTNQSADSKMCRRAMIVMVESGPFRLWKDAVILIQAVADHVILFNINIFEKMFIIKKMVQSRQRSRLFSFKC